MTIVEGKDSVILFSAYSGFHKSECLHNYRVNGRKDDNEYDHFTDENMEVLRTGVSSHTAGELGPPPGPTLLKASLQG